MEEQESLERMVAFRDKMLVILAAVEASGGLTEQETQAALLGMFVAGNFLNDGHRAGEGQIMSIAIQNPDVLRRFGGKDWFFIMRPEGPDFRAKFDPDKSVTTEARTHLYDGETGETEYISGPDKKLN